MVDAILPYLARFRAPGFSAGAWVTPEGQFPWFRSGATVDLFVKALYDHGGVVDFDWPAWEQAEAYVKSPDALASADVTTIQKLLAMHVRKERFCEGHLGAMFECGHIVAVLGRLAEIRQTLSRW